MPSLWALCLLASSHAVHAQTVVPAAVDGATLVVTRVGIGRCNDVSPASPPASLVATARAGRVRVDLRNYRYDCNTAPTFGAALTERVIHLRADAPPAPSRCVCLHASTLDIAPLSPGRYVIELWRPASEGSARPVSSVTIDVPADPPPPRALPR